MGMFVSPLVHPNYWRDKYRLHDCLVQALKIKVHSISLIKLPMDRTEPMAGNLGTPKDWRSVTEDPVGNKPRQWIHELDIANWQVQNATFPH